MSELWSSPELAVVAVTAAALAGLRPKPAAVRGRHRPDAPPAGRPPRGLVSADPRFGVVSTAVYTAVVMVPGGASAGDHR
jgi:hypothetical protein